MALLTIITPTYNRADCLPLCWRSLCAQTVFDFQWLIVDDGSTDDTAAVVRDLQARTDRFSIDYVSKPNGGKHTALNASHPHIRGEYVTVLDSDDTLTPDAVETILEKWKLFAQEGLAKGVYFLHITSNQQMHVEKIVVK